MREIAAFSAQTEFVGLEILDVQEEGSFATVTFSAHLIQDKRDISFTEKSYFKKEKGRWLYRRAQLL